MYEHEGLKDIFFIMLYGGATLLAIVACCYLLLTHGNMFLASVRPPRKLRWWAAAFMAAVAASHLWWVLLGIHWLEDDRLVRNIVAITLDRLTFVPLMMCVLLRMLQDRHRPLWPIAVVMVPIAVLAVICIVRRDTAFEMYTEWYSIAIGVVFTIYYVHAVRQHGQWLHENYADLEHKEVWQSLLLMAFILLVYVAYTSNEGDLVTEYLAQVNTLIIIGFVLWRIETLQQLDDSVDEETEESPAVNVIRNSPASVNIGELLQKRCEATQLYLQHELTLQQLAIAIGTNRTYLGNYFAQQGITYNAYINHLRIEHFIRLYRESSKTSSTLTAKAIAQQSGFRSYITFSAVFKKIIGTTVTEWIKSEVENRLP